MISLVGGRRIVEGTGAVSGAARSLILTIFSLGIGIHTLAQSHVGRSYGVGCILVNHFVTVAIALLALKQFSLICRVLVGELQSLLHRLVAHLILHVNSRVQFLSLVAIHLLTAATLETAHLVQCL